MSVPCQKCAEKPDETRWQKEVEILETRGKFMRAALELIRMGVAVDTLIAWLKATNAVSQMPAVKPYPDEQPQGSQPTSS